MTDMTEMVRHALALAQAAEDKNGGGVKEVLDRAKKYYFFLYRATG